MDAKQLAEAMGIPLARAERWALPILSAMSYAAIRSNEERSAFLAQIGHESGGLVHVREIWGPTPAQTRYEGRQDLGNTQPGDGFRYRGRGLIQITGRANYARLTKRLNGLAGPDFEKTPEALEIPKWAAWSAADYWLDRNLSRFCKPGRVRFIALTRAINGGRNGLDDRLRRYERAFKQGSA